MTISRWYRFLFTLSPWAIFAGMLHFHFQQFLPAQRLFKGLEFFDFISVTDLFVGVLFVLFVVGLVSGAIKLQERRIPTEWKAAIGMFLIAMGLQMLLQRTYEPVLSTPFEYFRSLFLFPLIFAVMAYQTLDDKSLGKLMRSYLAMVVMFCSLALIQHLTGWFPGEQKDFMGRLVWPYIDFLTLKSASANWVAFFVTPALVLSFIHSFDTLRSPDRKKLVRQEYFWLYGLTLILSIVTLYLTQSYGGYVAVLGAVTLYLFRALPFKRFSLALLIIGVIIGAGYLHQQTTWKYQVLTSQVDYRFANSAASRTDIYRMNFHMIQTYPLIGTGLNQYQSYFADHQVEVLGSELNESHIPPHAHNFFMSFWTSLGLFGFAAMLTLIVGIFWRAKFDPNNPAVFVLVAIMLHGLIESWYWKQEMAYFFWIMVMLSYLYRLPLHGKKEPWKR